eukprot:UN18704
MYKVVTKTGFVYGGWFVMLGMIGYIVKAISIPVNR